MQGAEEAGGITTARDALIQIRRGQVQVVDGLGAPIVDATPQSHGAVRAMDFVPRRPGHEGEALAGSWLYAGELWSHFGHFLFESLGRLWAFAELRPRIDGVIFVAAGREARLDPEGFAARMLALLGIDLPLRILGRSQRVERLVVPRPGCAMGHLAAGTPRFRAFVQDRLRQLPPRPDAPRVYVSRSGLRLRRGGMLAEEYLEQALLAEGYVTFRPEEASLEQQIATYLGARQIISQDCSALHLFGFVGRADQDLAVILRRRDGGESIRRQLAAGFIAAPDRLPGLTARQRAQHWNRAARRFGGLTVLQAAADAGLP